MDTYRVSAPTIIRTVCLVMAIINQILTSTGHSILPISDDQVTEVVSLIFTVATSVVAWWKNNSFTQEAIEADIMMHDAKSAR